MERYDYISAMRDDVREYIRENIDYIDTDTRADRDELREKLYNDMWIDDGVTGNLAGAYIDDVPAAERICYNLDLLADACAEFCADVDVLKSGADVCDVTIRCYLLYGVLSDVLDEMENSGEI